MKNLTQKTLSLLLSGKIPESKKFVGKHVMVMLIQILQADFFPSPLRGEGGGEGDEVSSALTPHLNSRIKFGTGSLPQGERRFSRLTCNIEISISSHRLAPQNAQNFQSDCAFLKHFAQIFPSEFLQYGQKENSAEIFFAQAGQVLAEVSIDGTTAEVALA